MTLTNEKYIELFQVNGQVNREFDYEGDQSGYSYGDIWKVMTGDDSGDCEDFALTKQQWLLDADWPVENLQIGTCLTETFRLHALMGVQTTNWGFLILDNRDDQLMTKEDWEGRNYHFLQFQLAGQEWAQYGVRKVGVPIEYMTCGASAFSDEDYVIVEFTDQDWSNPKVIGFASNPEPCEGNIYCGYGASSLGISELVAFDVGQNSWSEKNSIYNESWEELTAVNYQYYGFIFGGWRGTFDYIDYVENYALRYNAVENVSAMMAAYGGNYRDFSGSFAIGQNAYIVCGTEFPKGDVRNWRDHRAVYNDVTQYNMLTFVSTVKTVYPYANWKGEGFSANGKGYYCGGNRAMFRDSLNLLSNVFQYDEDLNIWSGKTSMPNFSYYHQTFGVSGYGCICAGMSPSGDLTTSYKYNHVTDGWNALPVIPTAYNRYGYGSKKGISGKGFVFSTTKPELGDTDSDLIIYNSVTGTWSTSIGTRESMGTYFPGSHGCSFSV